MFTEEELFNALNELLVYNFVEYVHENILNTKNGILLKDLPMDENSRKNLFDELQEEYQVLASEDFSAMFVLL